MEQLLAPAPIATPTPGPGPDLEATLTRVAASVSDSLGFATAVINLYRPAWDDFETVVVHGCAKARELLLHTTTTASEWAKLLDDRFNRHGAYFLEHGAFDWEEQVELSYVPAIEASSDPDAWHPEDALFVPLRASNGKVLGMLSVDEPADGRRPGPLRLEALVAVANQAALAVEAAQHAAIASQHRVAVEHLLRVSAELTSQREPGEILDSVCAAIRDALGYEKVTVLLRDERDVLMPRAAVGWSARQAAGLPGLPLADIKGLLDPVLITEGCVLVDQPTAHSLTGSSIQSVYRSVHNGRGPHAWNNHWLAVPLSDPDGRLVGMIWADDPVSRLRPTPEGLQALRAFANQALSALEASRREERLRYLAEHDPLTGLRNRRGLTEAIDAAIEAAGDGGVAVIVADVDGFKRVNDELGYQAGDRVLRSVADAFRGQGALAARLGGEEFAVVLPGLDIHAAYEAAESLRARASELVDVPWRLTLSAGVACSGSDCPSAEDMLRAATRAVFAAKRMGRDRVVSYRSEALAAMLGDDAPALEGGSQRRGHLAAVMLLAEALDLRDAGTAKHSHTVGRYAERIAEELGWDEGRVARMRVAGVLHDIGKLGVADALLHKAGPLADAEREEIQRHSELGARILQHAELPDLAAWVLAHHERMDGRGYPKRLSAEDIPLEARILSVADSYEAMTASRPYRPTPLPHEIAREELRRHAGTQFDPLVVEAFLRVLDTG